jgi:hypothetical protein
VEGLLRLNAHAIELSEVAHRGRRESILLSTCLGARERSRYRFEAQ